MHHVDLRHRDGARSPLRLRRTMMTPLLCLLLLGTATFAQTVKQDVLPGPQRSSARGALIGLGRDIDAIIADKAFNDASWGVSIVSCDNGESLYRHDEEKNRQFASNVKLLTTATALKTLGGDYRFSTDLYINGDVQSNGELNGSLVIHTAGDPSISPSFGVNPQEIIQGWARTLDSLGIKSVHNVVVDASYFDATPYAPGWAWDDETFGFNAPISSAAIFENSITVTVTPARTPGRSVQIDIFPPTAYVTLRVTAVTTRPDSVSTIDVRRERGSRTIVVSGNIATDAEPYVEHVSVERPPLFFATLVHEELKRFGITVRGSLFDAADYPEMINYQTLRKVAEYTSPPLRDIVAATNKQSLNLAAEMLLKKLGREYVGTGSTAAGLDVVKKVLGEIGIDTEHLRLYDGSGLSRQDMIAPADIATLLRWARRASMSGDFLASLAIAGKDGTLAERLKGTLAEGNVIGKTGYLNGIRAVSGYARTRDGEWLAYSIVVNNYSVPTSVVNTAQDLILMRLASFTRRG
jgi:D-alanyl-D-alanine carboxypeptidase/D-alanyl-D-alanine-endopeptidase (penicillin-binding protein 4)